MKKKYNNKEVTDDEESVKQPEIGQDYHEKIPEGLDTQEGGKIQPAKPQEATGASEKAEGMKMCIRECEIPFVGAWKPGDIISDSKILKQIGDNPNFEITGGSSK